MFESCEGCFAINEQVPAFTMRINYHSYPKEWENEIMRQKPEVSDRRGDKMALEIFFTHFRLIIKAATHIMVKAKFYKRSELQIIDSYHYFVNMDKSQDQDTGLTKNCPHYNWFVGSSGG